MKAVQMTIIGDEVTLTAVKAVKRRTTRSRTVKTYIQNDDVKQAITDGLIELGLIVLLPSEVGGKGTEGS